MNQFFVLLVVVLSTGLGIIIGETYAPISGHTVYTLSLRVESLEAQAEKLNVRTARLESDWKTLSARLASVGILP